MCSKNLSLHLLLLFTGISAPAYAQNRLTDSLQRELSKPAISPGEQSLLYSELAASLRFMAPDKGIEYARRAASYARTQGDGKFGVHAYNSLSLLHLMKDSLRLAMVAADSCDWFASRTEDPIALATADFRRAGIHNINHQQEETILSIQRVFRHLGKKENLQLEAQAYYTMYSVYAELDDWENEEKYARLCLKAALRSRDPNLIVTGWEAMGIAHQFRYDNTGDRRFLDSTLYANKQAMNVSRDYKDVMINPNAIAASALNTANSYFEYFDGKMGDSVMLYTGIALNAALLSRNAAIIANCYGLLNEEARKRGRLDDAEALLRQALAILEKDLRPNYYPLSNICLSLAELLEERGRHQQALVYYKKYLDYFKKRYDAVKLRESKRLEAQFRYAMKAESRSVSKELGILQRVQLYLYIGLALLGIMGLVFMIRSFYYSRRYARQREMLLVKEKEEARLLLQLKTEEALRASLEKKEAEKKASAQETIAQIQTEKADRLEASAQILTEEQAWLRKEILAGNLQINQKNDFFMALRERFGKSVPDIDKIFLQENRQSEDLDQIRRTLRELHPSFFRQLEEKAGQKLTPLEEKYCAFIYLKLSNKQMADMLHVEPKSIQMYKYRLKQKLGLDKSASLDVYIQSIN
ncbi:tetratricopeptide repeat protein [Chitinophaga deserti]|uniref:tetratricopeptide repeat protein n=1 Tax=Chitinophaga deserti TaxID=2164099 RepID=UPI0013005247|nr:tetratricopeptide repeat protein [Chitinophaga deserti]